MRKNVERIDGKAICVRRIWTWTLSAGIDRVSAFHDVFTGETLHASYQKLKIGISHELAIVMKEDGDPSKSEDSDRLWGRVLREVAISEVREKIRQVDARRAPVRAHWYQVIAD